MSYDNVKAKAQEFAAAGAAIGGDAGVVAAALRDAFIAFEPILDGAKTRPKPQKDEAVALLQPVNDHLAVIDKTQMKRDCTHISHCKAVNDAGPAVAGWVLAAKPVAIIENYADAMMFNANKVLTANKGVAEHQAFVRTLKAVIAAHKDYVQNDHASGLMWSAGGVAAPASTGPATSSGGFDVVIAAFEKLAASAAKIGGDCESSAKALVAVCQEQKAVLAKASCSAKPSDAELQALAAPMNAQLKTVSDNQMKRDCTHVSHCKALNDAAPAFGWIFAGKPVGLIEGYADAMMFNANKVLTANKGVAEHQEFVRNLKAAVAELLAFVKAEHKMGLSWGTGGGSASSSGHQDPSCGGGQSFDSVEAAFLAVSTAGEKIGGDCALSSKAFADAAKLVADIVRKAASGPKPSDADMQQLLAPIQQQVKTIDDIQRKRDCTHVSHCKALNDAAPVFGWVVASKPLTLIEGHTDAMMFNGNKVLTANKGVAEHVDFVKALKKAMADLTAFVTDGHKTGLTWSAASAPLPPPPPPPVAGKGLPPPPPPPPPAAASGSSASASEPSLQEKLFAELRQKTDGVHAAKGLRHVEDSEKTHKQKNRETKVIDEEAFARMKAANKRRKGWMPPTGDAFSGFKDKSYSIEYQVGAEGAPKVLEVTECEKSHQVNLYRCYNTTVQVTTKVNAITINECRDVRLVCNDTLGPVEISKSEDVDLRIRISAPTVVIDSVKGATVHLSDTALEAEIVTANIAACNITVPAKDAETGFDIEAEIPLPEQYETVIAPRNKLKTTPVDHGA